MKCTADGMSKHVFSITVLHEQSQVMIKDDHVAITQLQSLRKFSRVVMIMQFDDHLDHLNYLQYCFRIFQSM